MLSTKSKLRHSVQRLIGRHSGISLSSYYPKGTNYFYGYPAGEDSGFLNNVPPEVEELVAARALSCAGTHVTAIVFKATEPSAATSELFTKFAIPQLRAEQMRALPAEINAGLVGKQRNRAIKKSLAKLVAPGKLVMAQPFTDANLSQLFQIPPQLTAWLNDKSNMEQYISRDLMPHRLAVYQNGKQFYKDYLGVPVPCVIKASSSSAGDGVYICRSESDILNAAKILRNLSGTILVEEHIAAKKNYGIHFAIPHSKRKKVTLLGVNEQLTSREGAFLGGIINSREFPSELQKTRSLPA